MEKKSGTDLKKRIAIALVFTIVLSVLFVGIAYYGLVRYTMRSLGREYGISNPTYENLYNNTLLISRAMDEEISHLRDEVKASPEMLEDTEMLAERNQKLVENVVFMVVIKGKDIVFDGSKYDSALAMPEHRIEEIVSQFENVKDDIFSGQTSDGALVRKAKVVFSDGTEGSVFLLSTLERVVPQIRALQFNSMMLVIIILTSASLLLGRWLYRGIERPINDLKDAAQNIRDGNLDFSVKTSGIEELDELCRDFEEMRIRLKESAESKIENEKQSRELVSNISHDLKTPVTAIKGYVEGIIDGVADTPEKMDHYLKTIRNKANEVDRLINELTAYSHIDANRIPYNFTKLDAAAFFSDCAEEVSLDLEDHGIAFSYFNYLTEETSIIADPEQLRRVINNIIGNSIKYRDKEFAFVNLRLRDVGDFVQAEIEDNGCGIAQQDLTHVFDRFYRSDTARSSEGGSGIGLSIVKKILEDHEGKVWATSKEGEGTVIYFVLRKYQEPEEGETAAETRGVGIAKILQALPKSKQKKEREGG